MRDGGLPLYLARMYFSLMTKGSGGMAAFLSMMRLSEVLMRVDTRGGLRLGRAMVLVVAPLVIGVICVCAEPGSRLAALDGEEEGRPFLEEVVVMETLGFFVFVAVPVVVAFDILTTFFQLPTSSTPSALRRCKSAAVIMRQSSLSPVASSRIRA